MSGDSQCVSIPVIDNDTPDGNRTFIVQLTTFDQLVRVTPGSNSAVVIIADDERKYIPWNIINTNFIKPPKLFTLKGV